MGVQNPNSTSYEHPDEPNLLNVHKALDYNDAGEPALRVKSFIQGDVVIQGNVNVPGTVTIDNQHDNPVHTHVENEAGTSLAINDNGGSITVDGTVAVSNFPATQTVDGTVNIGTMPEVEIKNDTGNPVPVSGTVTANQGTSPWVISGNVTTTPATTTLTDYFGTPLSIEMVPYVQINSYEGIKDREVQVYTGGGGTVIQNDTDIDVSCTTTPGSYAVYRSRRFIPYRAGQSGIGRVMAKFDTPQLGTQQRVGIANQEGSYYIGYNGANDAAGNYNDIKFLHSYGGLAEIWSMTVTGTASANQTVTVTLNNIVYTVNILSGDTPSIIASKIASGVDGISWLASSKSNQVSFLSGSLGALAGTFSAVSTGNVSFSLTEQTSGQAETNEWLPMTIPAGINTASYNVWQFRYAWGGVEIYVLNTTTNQMVLIFQHGLTNDVTLPVRKPAFKPTAVCYNTGGSTAVSMNVAYLFGATEGGETITSLTYAGGVTKTSLSSGTYHHIMSIQNPYVNQAYKLNFRTIRFLDLTVAAQVNDPIELYIVYNAGITGNSFNWQEVPDRLYSASFTTGTINIANETPVVALIVGLSGAQSQFNLADYHLIIPPGDHMSLVAYSTASIQKIAVAGTWATIG